MRIGVDLGGTKIEVLALHDDGREVLRRRVATPREYEACLDTVARQVLEVERELGVSGTVGVGLPGAVSPATGLIKNANSTFLNGRPVPRDLGARLGREVRVRNDANCFALSEAVDGAGAGADVVLGVILGTGCGGGLAIRGHSITGTNAIAGEWGHNPLPWPGPDELDPPRCWCGHLGCLEVYLSGPAMANDHRRVTGAQLTPPEIVEAAGRGDAQAEDTLERYEGRLARALATAINLLDPDVIVLGGGLSQLGRLYESVPRLWVRWVFSDRVDTRLRPPVHGDSSGVRGAAWLWGGWEGAPGSS